MQLFAFVNILQTFAFVTHSFILYELTYLDTCSYIELFWLIFFLTGTDYSYYHAILKAAFQFLSPLQQNLLKFCLSLRSYSATIQAFQQVSSVLPCDSTFFRGCITWLDILQLSCHCVTALYLFYLKFSRIYDLFVNNEQNWLCSTFK